MPSTTYTRTGDDGQTTLGDLSRTAKSDPRIAAYGDCEEACALLGVVVAAGTGLPNEMVRLLTRLQNDLVDVGADLCAPPDGPGAEAAALRVDEGYVARLERACDHFNAGLRPSSSFAVPGGTVSAASLHHARSVVRRAERTAQGAIERELVSPIIGTYLNRLGSLLLILARAANVEHGDTPWEPGLSAGLAGVELWEPIPEPDER